MADNNKKDVVKINTLGDMRQGDSKKTKDLLNKQLNAIDLTLERTEVLSLDGSQKLSDVYSNDNQAVEKAFNSTFSEQFPNSSQVDKNALLQNMKKLEMSEEILLSETWSGSTNQGVNDSSADITGSVNCRIIVASKDIDMVNPHIQIDSVTGEHTKVVIQGIIHQHSYKYLMGVDTMVDVKVIFGEEDHVLFWGVITHFDLQVGRAEDKEIRELFLEANSFSIMLDQEPRQRAFQNKESSYTDIVDVIVGDNANTNYLVASEAHGKVSNRFIVQYRETDWMFLKRLASQLGLPIVASHHTYGPKFTFGVKWGVKPFILSEEEQWQVDIVHSAISYSPDGFNKEQRNLRWHSDKPRRFLGIGDSVNVGGDVLYIKETHVEIKDYASVHEYVLGSKADFEIYEKSNFELRGLSLPGTVEEVVGNQIRPNLDIDVIEERNSWFTYATFYSTFFCMPEVGDRIYMYFPNDVEANAYILNSVRTSPAEGADGSLLIADATYEDGDAQMAKEGSFGDTFGTQSVQAYDITNDVVALANTAGADLVDMQISTDNQSYSSINPNPTAAKSGGGENGSGSGGGSASAPPQQPSYDFNSMAGDAKQKVLSTPDGKQVILNDGDGSVTVMLDAANYIVLKGNEISITSSGMLWFTAEDDITLSTQRIMTLTANDKVQLGCGSSAIEMKPSEITINADDIKINE